MSDEITIWIRQLGEASPEAAEKIWNHYYQKLVHFASRRLGGAPRRLVDEEDIVVSAMHSFHRGVMAGRFPKLDSRDDLWKILLTITNAKAQKSKRREMAQKRGGGHVRGESVFALAGTDDQADGLANIQGREPTPEFAEMISMECDDLLGQLGDPKLQEIAVLKLQGYTNEEIAVEQKIAVRSVERKLQRIRLEWSEQLSNE